MLDTTECRNTIHHAGPRKNVHAGHPNSGLDTKPMSSCPNFGNNTLWPARPHYGRRQPAGGLSPWPKQGNQLALPRRIRWRLVPLCAWPPGRSMWSAGPSWTVGIVSLFVGGWVTTFWRRCVVTPSFEVTLEPWQASFLRKMSRRATWRWPAICAETRPWLASQ